MTLAQFTETSLLVPRLLSEFRDSTISELSGHLEKAGCIENARTFTHAVLDHESLASAVFGEVGVPLARDRVVRKLSFALGLSPQGIRWGTARTPVVHTVILFAVPLTEGQRYLSLLLTISSFLKDEMAFGALQKCTHPEDMWTALNHVYCARTGSHAVRSSAD